LLMDGILIPAHAGQPVSFRPPRWDEHHRHGAIEVAAGCPLLIIEGVGAGRRESAYLTDAAVWVQADERETEHRNLARVGQPGESPTVQHMRDWMAEEIAGPRPAVAETLEDYGNPRPGPPGCTFLPQSAPACASCGSRHHAAPARRLPSHRQCSRGCQPRQKARTPACEEVCRPTRRIGCASGLGQSVTERDSPGGPLGLAHAARAQGLCRPCGWARRWAS
jgi:hypothetical protein